MYKLYHGDCLVESKHIEDGSVDLILTDPPYTMTTRGKSCRPNWMPNNMGQNVFNGDIPDSLEWMSECFRILKAKSHFYTFCNTNDIQIFLNSASKCGFKLHNIITMIKDTMMPNRWYLKQSELILFFRKGEAKPINDYTSRDNINVVMPKKSTNKLHITEKPLSIIEKFILNSTTDNQIVFDPFMGSGTTGVACMNTNRKFIGIELDDNYFNIATERIKSASNLINNDESLKNFF